MRLNNKGLSFVEVMMATMVLAILMASLFVVYQTAANMSYLALHKLAAVCWAQSALERTKSDHTTAGVTFTDPQGTNIIRNGKGGTITGPTTTNLPGLRQLSVTIGWTE